MLLLTLPDDVDTAVLGRLVCEQAADLSLTAAQQQTHQRLCARWIRLLNDPAPGAHYTA